MNIFSLKSLFSFKTKKRKKKKKKEKRKEVGYGCVFTHIHKAKSDWALERERYVYISDWALVRYLGFREKMRDGFRFWASYTLN